MSSIKLEYSKFALSFLFLIIVFLLFFIELKFYESLINSLYFSCIIGIYFYFKSFFKNSSFILHIINFSFLFTFIIPYLYQVKNSVYLMNYDVYGFSNAIYLNLILSITFLVLLNNFIEWESSDDEIRNKIFFNKKRALFLTSLIILIIVIIYFTQNNFSIIFATRDIAYLSMINFKDIYYFILLPKVLISGLCIYLIYLLKKTVDNTILIFSIIFLIILNYYVNYPASTPRFIIGSFYLGVALVLVDYNKLKTRLLFMILMPLSYYSILTYLSATTRSFAQGSYDLSDILSFNFLGSLDFDTFFTATLAIQYVNENSPNFGLSLISALFVVFPRSVWVFKALPSGDIFNTYFNLPYTNTSCNLVCESYMNFSILGVFIFYFIFGKFQSILLNIKNTNYSIIYIIVSAYFMLIYRGSLAAAFSYLTPLIFIFYVIVKFSERKKT